MPSLYSAPRKLHFERTRQRSAVTAIMSIIRGPGTLTCVALYGFLVTFCLCHATSGTEVLYPVRFHSCVNLTANHLILGCEYGPNI